MESEGKWVDLKHVIFQGKATGFHQLQLIKTKREKEKEIDFQSFKIY